MRNINFSEKDIDFIIISTVLLIVVVCTYWHQSVDYKREEKIYSQERKIDSLQAIINHLK